MALQFTSDVTDGEREILNRAHEATLLAAAGDSNDGEIEALNDMIGVLMSYAGIKDDGTTQANHCDSCGEVSLEISNRDLCPSCEAEDGLVECPNCDQYVDPGELETYPAQNGPVTMCRSCVHDARRSGWEPGQ